MSNPRGGTGALSRWRHSARIDPWPIGPALNGWLAPKPARAPQMGAPDDGERVHRTAIGPRRCSTRLAAIVTRRRAAGEANCIWPTFWRFAARDCGRPWARASAHPREVRIVRTLFAARLERRIRRTRRSQCAFSAQRRAPVQNAQRKMPDCARALANKADCAHCVLAKARVFVCDSRRRLATSSSPRAPFQLNKPSATTCAIASAQPADEQSVSQAPSRRRPIVFRRGRNCTSRQSDSKRAPSKRAKRLRVDQKWSGAN